MSTVDDKAIVAQILRNDGRYPGDPQLALIYSYLTLEGNLTAAVYLPSAMLAEQVYEFKTSPFVYAPVLLWSAECGLTREGEEWIQSFGEKK
jgi:hypothetical protein